MKLIKSIFAVSLFAVLTTTFIGANHALTKEGSHMQKTVTAEGTIQKQGMTTYQYGTHVLKDGNKTTYALMSKSQKLDSFVGKHVKVTGTLVDGYPLDGGPDYMEVSAVEIK